MLQASLRSEYGTRALVELAERWGHSPVGLSHIAERQMISFKYLEQIMILLRKNGLVKGVRGKSGGYALARAPERISMTEVVAALEGGLQVMECPPHGRPCPVAKGCRMRRMWRDIEGALEGVLVSYTLADLIPRRGRGGAASGGNGRRPRAAAS